MPTINRIRIVNIFYDGRIIKDSIFDYYGGRNALMNLNNGGGKTVMIETIFQPIIPGMDIDGWKITDYLTGDQKPSYVMIEWMLDGTKKPSYFMTGICLSKTNVRGDDDKNIKVLKYFTFVHDYDQGNEFDIKNINVSEERDGKNVICHFSTTGQKSKKVMTNLMCIEKKKSKIIVNILRNIIFMRMNGHCLQKLIRMKAIRD